MSTKKKMVSSADTRSKKSKIKIDFECESKVFQHMKAERI